MDTRCCWPPESWLGLCLQLVAQAHHLQGRSGPAPAAPAWERRRTSGAPPRSPAAFSLGSRLYCWKMKPSILLRISASWFLSIWPTSLPVQQVGAGGGHVQAADDVHAGGLAGAGLAHDGHELPLLDLEGDVVRRLHRGVAHLVILADLPKFDQSCSFRSLLGPPLGIPPPEGIPPPLGMPPIRMAGHAAAGMTHVIRRSWRSQPPGDRPLCPPPAGRRGPQCSCRR